MTRKFQLNDRVRKTQGSSWQGRICGLYATALTPYGYAVESEREPGSVQIYPEGALALVPDEMPQEEVPEEYQLALDTAEDRLVNLQARLAAVRALLTSHSKGEK